jgi:hypothetical protein
MNYCNKIVDILGSLLLQDTLLLTVKELIHFQHNITPVYLIAGHCQADGKGLQHQGIYIPTQAKRER